MATLGQVIDGLVIIAKHCGRNEHFVSAEHDILYADPGDVEVPETDKERLEKLGWFLDGESNWWATFV